MKSLIVSMLLITLCADAFAQSSKINDEYFVLGTLNDFDGRRQNPAFEGQFDYYYKYRLNNLPQRTRRIRKGHKEINNYKLNFVVFVFFPRCSLW